MSLSKQQTIGVVGAGIFLVLAGGLGWMVYSAWSDRTEAEEQLEDETGAYRRYHESPVFPSKLSIASVKSNETSYAAWHESAVALAARGDRFFAQETPPIFKQRLQAEVRRLAGLAGGVNGNIAKADFLFGFEQFLGEGGVLPQSAEVPRLAVQLDTISKVVDICAEAGVLEIKSVVRVEAPKDEEGDDEDRPKKKKGKQAKSEEDSKVTCLEYTFELATRPAGFVGVLNALTSDERFYVVKDLSFRESSDMIVDKIAARDAAEQQKSRPAATSGRRSRRMAAAQDAAAATATQNALEKEDRVVVDPELDAPIVVKFTLAVHDFGKATAPTAPTTSEAKDGEKPAGTEAKDGDKPVAAKPAEDNDQKKEGK